MMLFVSLAALLAGTTHYVDPAGGDDNNPGTMALPKKTIVALAPAPGDTVILRGTAHYPTNHFTALGFSGTAEDRITVESHPGEVAIFDPGYEEFKEVPNTAWVPCTPMLCPPSEPFGMPAHADEYVSQSTFSTSTAYGTFLGSGDRLFEYDRLEDLRADNEMIELVAISDPRPGAPLWADASKKYLWTYRGPGLWWNPITQKIHFRASPTHYDRPGVEDYAGPSDPRGLALSIASLGTVAARIEASHITFRNIVFQNGGGRETVSVYYDPVAVTFDHCTFNAARYALRTARTRSLKLEHCVIDSHLPSYAGRSDTKDFWEINENGVMTSADGTRRTSQMQLTSNGDSEDMEIAHCEFRNAHDSVQLFDLRTKVHHSLFENINDEVFSFQFGNPDGVEVHDNVIRQALSTFSFAQQGAVSGSRYIYRNILDNRMPTLGIRTTGNIWRAGTDFKMNSPVDAFYFYHNTIIQGPPEYLAESAIFDTCVLTHPRDRYFVNNIHMTILGDKPLHVVPNAAFPAWSDGNIWFRRINEPLSALYLGVAPPAGWDAHSLFTDPAMVNVADYVHPHGVPHSDADYRLKASSPARQAGIDLTAYAWPDSVPPDPTPDIGALPFGAPVLAVGVDGRVRFPDEATPIAEAGNYSVTTDVNQDGFEAIALDSAGSSDPDGSILDYDWSVAGSSIGTGPASSFVLPVGDHHVLLTTVDDDGREAIDMRQVTIKGFDNLVSNSSFEESAAGWSSAQAVSTPGSPVRFGARALEVPALAGIDAAVTQRVPVTPGARVAISGFIEGSGFSGAYHYSKISVRWLDASNATLGWSEGVATFNTPYLLRAINATVPAAAVTGELNLIVAKNSNPAVAHFDDLYLAITDNKLQNAHFERGLTSWVAGGSAAIGTDARSRTGALRFNGGASLLYIHQSVPVTQGQAVAVSGWVKTENLPAGKFAQIMVQWTNAADATIATAWTGQVGGTSGGYVLLSTTLTVPTGTGVAKLKVLPRIEPGTSGATVHFDDIYVR